MRALSGVVAGVTAVGLTAAAVVAAAAGIPAADAVELIGTSFGVALVSALVGLLVVAPMRAGGTPGRALRVRAAVVAVTPALCLGLGSWAAARAMFVSPHDLDRAGRHRLRRRGGRGDRHLAARRRVGTPTPHDRRRSRPPGSTGAVAA
ncbi:MAG: hypothetical protein V9G12_20220 [Microthrixaceae bacterium]